MEVVNRLFPSQQSVNLIFHFLLENECLLPDPLSLHVSLFDYAKKLNEYGNNYVYSCNDVACGLVAGYINDFQNHEAYIQVLIVASGYQGKGIGTLLITRFLEDARLILGYEKYF